MTNNLQAKELNKLYIDIYNLVSEDIKIDDISKLKIGNWIEIEATKIKFNYIYQKEIIANSTLEVIGEYAYLDTKKIKVKELKGSFKKGLFKLKILLKDRLKEGRTAISKLPLETVLEGKDFKAIASLYFNGKFLVEIKEIL